MIARSLFFAFALLATLVAVNAFTRPMPLRAPRASRSTELYMGGKMSKFGIFSPAVYAAKFILGEAKLNKVSIEVRMKVSRNI
jgi:hypothetical protein